MLDDGDAEKRMKLLILILQPTLYVFPRGIQLFRSGRIVKACRGHLSRTRL